MTDNGKHSYIRISNLDVSGYDEGPAIYGWNSSTGSIHGFSDIIVDNCRFHHNLSTGGATWADMIGGISDIAVRNNFLDLQGKSRILAVLSRNHFSSSQHL